MAADKDGDPVPNTGLRSDLLMIDSCRVLFHHFDRFLAEYEDRFERETMDYLEFIARVTAHIPDQGHVMVRYYGQNANAHRGKATSWGVWSRKTPGFDEMWDRSQ